MNFLMSGTFTVLILILYVAFFLLVTVTLVKLLKVLFKADRAIDEIRQYIRR